MIRLIVFARYPVPGQAKTRLIPALGPAGAARLQHAMTQHTLRIARAWRRQVGSAEVELRYTGASEAQLTSLYGRDLLATEQGTGDLGQRMLRAIQDAVAAGSWPIVVGSDCPAVDVDLLHAACRALDRGDLVLGPARDGGYYLIGMRRPEVTLFRAISWSTAAVLQQTLAAAHRLGLCYELLPELPDVDEPTDLPNARGLLTVTAPYRPRHIAITGATGSLGLQVLRTVLHQHPRLHVAALVRRRSAWPEAFTRLLAKYGEQVELVEGELCHLSPEVRRAFDAASDGIWHFAALTQLRCRDEPMRRQLWRTNVEGTRSLLDGCASPFFHVSSAYVCGGRTGIICEADLDAGSGFRNAYEESKFAAEQIVRSALDGGRPGAVFRSGVVVSAPARGGGKGLKVVDQVADALAMAIRRCAPGVTFRAAEGWGINAVAGQWVIDRMLELASDPAGRTYHLTAPDPLTLGQVRDAAHALYPWFHIDFAPGSAGMHGISRAVDRALSGYRDYLAAAAEVRFDRIRTQLYASGAEEPALDVASCLHLRVGATPRAGMPVPS